MPLSNDTRRVVGEKDGGVNFLHASRSLMLDRFANPGLKEEKRREFFENAFAKTPRKEKLHAWSKTFLGSPLLSPEQVVYAQLQSRLMVNMAGGVMENAGICLDLFGMPYIPGSAVKGCVRRLALAALREWSQTGVRPGIEEGGEENLFKPACEGFETPSEMLAAIARTFGWTEEDWKNGSDFVWACNVGEASSLSEQAGGSHYAAAIRLLAKHLNVKLDGDEKRLWKLLPNFAGSVSFLPAYPVDVKSPNFQIRPPSVGALELDVVTCHHPLYYADDSKMPVALDVEDPNPVVFPAVAPGHVFAFCILPTKRAPAKPEVDGRQAESSPLHCALVWLRLGLQVFGVGAKTNAGYGWFDCSNKIQRAVESAFQAEAQRAKNAEELERKEKEEEERRRKAAEEKKTIAGMTPDQLEDHKLANMNEQQLRQHIEKIDQRTPVEKGAIYRLLRAGKQDLWREIRDKAEKGNAKEKQRFSPVAQKMFKMAKDRNEKMPK